MLTCNVYWRYFVISILHVLCIPHQTRASEGKYLQMVVTRSKFDAKEVLTLHLADLR